MPSSAGSSLASSANSGLVPCFQAPRSAAAAEIVSHWWPALAPVRPRGMGFAFAGLLAQAGGASQLVTLRQGRGGLQVQLDLAGHADPGQVAFGNPMLLTDAADAVGERNSPAHQRDSMFRADRIDRASHTDNYGILGSVSQKS